MLNVHSLKYLFNNNRNSNSKSNHKHLNHYLMQIEIKKILYETRFNNQQVSFCLYVAEGQEATPKDIGSFSITAIFKQWNLIYVSQGHFCWK